MCHACGISINVVYNRQILNAKTKIPATLDNKKEHNKTNAKGKSKEVL